MGAAVRAACLGLVFAVLVPPTSTQASAPIVPPAGQVQATLLAPQHGHHAATKILKPLHTPHPDALKAAKEKAGAAAQHPAGTATPAAPSPNTVFNGLDQPGLQASDEGNAATPPDPTGAIGPADYVEMVNQLVGVYDRNTLALISSLDFATFSHVPSGMATSDPQIQWDPVANRWLYAMVGISTGNNYLLFGWTKTADPSNLSGGWCTFGVSTTSHLQDYPKLGHDAHWVIVGANAYSDVNSSYPFETAQIWAFPKPAASDTTCSSPVNATFFADATHPLKNADGTLAFTPVPANTTDAGNDYIVGSRDVSVAPASKLMLWHMEARPAPTLVPDGDITVGTYSVPPGVPQPGSAFLIDSLDGRNTQAVARFDPSAGAEALWTQHTIAGTGGPAVVRWYEILPATRTIRQQGLLSSPTDYFWNAAISPSAAGNEAMIEYNRGSAAQLALIGAQTRSSSTPLSQMDPGEILLGTSSAPMSEDAFQGNCNPNPCRWGDYSGTSPDLSNPHVVWGSNEVIGPAFFGFAQWQTKNFAVSTVPPAPDFSLSASPTSQTVIRGSSTSYTINVSSVGGFGGSVTLSVSGLPAGAGGTFSPNPVTGTSSTLAVTTASTTATGSYSLTITGTSGSLTHTTGATLVVSPPPPPDFSLSASPGSQTVIQGAPASTTYTINVTRVSGFAGSVTFTVSGLPSGASGSFAPNPTTANASTLSVTTGATTPLGTYTLTVTGTGAGLTHTTTATLVVSPPPPCSSAGLTPASPTQPLGSTVQFTASATGCSNPQYEYWVQYLDGTWHVLRAFSTDPTFGWNTSGLALGVYTVTVWANNVGDATSTWEAAASSKVTLTGGCTGASLSPSSTTVTAGSVVQFAAGATGCPNPQFEYWAQYLDGSWHMLRAFSTDPTFGWNTAGLALGSYSVTVWANNVGDATSTWEASASSKVTLMGGCTGASLTPAAPNQAVGSTIQFTAGATGCPNPQYEYWAQYLDGSWHVLRAFSTDPTFGWNTAGLPLGVYTVTVWANNVGDATSTFEASASSKVTLTGGCTAASLSPAGPTQPIASTVQFTASAGGCPNPQYEYWAQYLDGSWHMLRAFSTDPTFGWSTAGLAPGVYTVTVWANNAGDATSTWEASGLSKVTLTGCASASLTASSSSVSGGASVTFTASASGCSAPVYEFWLQDPGGSWHLMQPFSSSSTWVWNTAGSATGTYNVYVWANQLGADTSSWESYGSATVSLS